MRNFLSSAVGVMLLIGGLSGCGSTTTNEEWCRDFYGLTPGSWDYKFCIDNDGETFESMYPKLE